MIDSISRGHSSFFKEYSDSMSWKIEGLCIYLKVDVMLITVYNEGFQMFF